MSNKGQAIVDFGGHPGDYEATIDITGQTGIVADSSTDAWVVAVASLDHTAEDHRYLATLCAITTGNIVPGVGFTVYAHSQEQLEGKITIQWAWA